MDIGGQRFFIYASMAALPAIPLYAIFSTLNPKIMKSNVLSLAMLIVISQFALAQNRSYDGTMNNLSHVNWGAAGGEITRFGTNGYADGVSVPGMPNYPNPRLISQSIFEQLESMPNPYNISDFAWAFGHLIDHALTLVLAERRRATNHECR